VDRIAPAAEGQVRQDFDEERLESLAESLKRSGVREPIIVTPHGADAGHFQIVAGERRWRAAQLAGLTEIPCIVDPGLVERKDKLLAQAEENLHRENLNALEEAAALAQIMEARSIDVKEAGQLLGKSPRQARRMLQLHGAVPPIKRGVARGQLDARAAVEMVRIHNRYLREDDSPSGSHALRRIEALIGRYVKEEWSVRRLEKFAAKLDAGEDAESERHAQPPDASKNRASASEPTTPEERPRETLPPTASARPVSVFTRSGRKLVLDVGRIESRELSAEERANVIALLEQLLFETRRA
jgi:ParB/RepB/Spo0J family partition protein